MGWEQNHQRKNKNKKETKKEKKRKERSTMAYTFCGACLVGWPWGVTGPPRY
jgi:hypothetical protein